jgi:senataxin
MSAETKRELIDDSKRRHKVAYKYSIVFGLAPEDTGAMREEYTFRLNRLLTTCDKCDYNWHMGRKGYMKEISE